MENIQTREQAAAFLYRSTYGPKLGDVDSLLRVGVDTWFEQQFSSPPEFLSKPEERHGYDTTLCGAWWQRAITANDQLRQRVAFALSQIFVVGNGGGEAEVRAYYYDMLLNFAFDNHKTLLKEVTLSLGMSIFLSLRHSLKADKTLHRYPDENYAREFMQLFTIGTHQLNGDGSPKYDVNNELIPTYTQADVEELARVLTGWFSSFMTSPPELRMYPRPWADHRDSGEKRVLGITFAAGQTHEQDLDQAIELLFNHSNTPPFFSHLLIQRLTTSNPSPAYIERVASVFIDNGDGVRGDLKAVIKAVLLDPEVNNLQMIEAYIADKEVVATSGRLKEPMIGLANFYRSLNIQSDTTNTYWDDMPATSYGLSGQQPMRAPSVFNFYSPDYAPKGTIQSNNIVAPEFYVYTARSTWGLNRAAFMAIHFNSTEPWYESSWYWDSKALEACTDNPRVFVDQLNEQFFAGLMPKKLEQYLGELAISQHHLPPIKQVTTMLFAIQQSPEFNCQV